MRLRAPWAFSGPTKEKLKDKHGFALRPIGPNNRISRHEDWVKQGQSVHGAADLGLEIGRCRRFLCPILSIYVRFLSRFPIDLGNQHLNRSPQKLIRPGIKMIDIEKAVGSLRMPSAGNQ